MVNSQTATVKDLTHFVDTEFMADRIDTEEHVFYHKLCETFFKLTTL